MIRYKECQRNHAAHLGSHVVDGCGEFMPAGNEGTTEFLRCAACNCHRNFHRRESNNQLISPPPPPPPHTLPAGNGYISFNKVPPDHTAAATAVMMAFGSGGVAAESSSEDLNGYRVLDTGMNAKKRFRTKFSEEQKEKMSRLAEKLGWKMHKQNEELVLELCNELGIKRQVFKVWMHNNKQAIMKRRLIT